MNCGKLEWDGARELQTEVQMRLVVQRVVDFRGLDEKMMAWEGLLLGVLARELEKATNGSVVMVADGMANEGWEKGIWRAKGWFRF